MIVINSDSIHYNLNFWFLDFRKISCIFAGFPVFSFRNIHVMYSYPRFLSLSNWASFLKFCVHLPDNIFLELSFFVFSLYYAVRNIVIFRLPFDLQRKNNIFILYRGARFHRKLVPTIKHLFVFVATINTGLGNDFSVLYWCLMTII